MRLKITERALASLEPKAPTWRTKVWDDELAGFGAIVGRRGVVFIVQARLRGKQLRVTIGRQGDPRPDRLPWSATLARRRAKEILGQIAAGIDPNAGDLPDDDPTPPAPAGPTLRDALNLHLEAMRKGRNRRKRPCSPRSIATLEGDMQRHFVAWLDRPIVELTGLELKALLAKVESGVTAKAGAVNTPGLALVNRLTAQISALWNAADLLYDLPGKNPAKRVGQAALKPRDERIPDDGFPAWYAAVQKLSPVRRDLQELALFTGLRSESARTLRWENVDEVRGLLHVARAKGDKPYTIPLTATVAKILARRRKANPDECAVLRLESDGGWIFPSRSARKPYCVICVAEPKEWRTVLDAVGAPVLDADGRPMREKAVIGMHPLRRTFNSIAIELGIAKEDRLTLMNHEGAGVNAKHYAAPERWDHLAACAARIEAAIWERIRARPDRALKAV